MDIRLKGKLNGIEAAQTIYDNYGIPSLLMTAYSLEEFNNTYRLPVDVKSFQKPIYEEELLDCIKNVLKL